MKIVSGCIFGRLVDIFLSIFVLLPSPILHIAGRASSHKTKIVSLIQSGEVTLVSNFHISSIRSINVNDRFRLN